MPLSAHGGFARHFQLIAVASARLRKPVFACVLFWLVGLCFLNLRQHQVLQGTAGLAQVVVEGEVEIFRDRFESFQLQAPRYVLNPGTAICAGQDIYLLVYVNSAVGSFAARKAIRETYGDETQFEPVSIRVVFVLGDTTDGAIRLRVQQEASRFKDMVQESFLDTYYNLTYKTVSALRWVAAHCKEARFVMKVDEDVFVDMYKLLRSFRSLEPPRISGGYLWCAARLKEKVLRSTKYRVSTAEYPGSMYPPFCAGPAYAMTMEAVLALHSATFRVPFLKLEDVWLTGLVAESLRQDRPGPESRNPVVMRDWKPAYQNGRLATFGEHSHWGRPEVFALHSRDYRGWVQVWQNLSMHQVGLLGSTSR